MNGEYTWHVQGISYDFDLQPIDTAPRAESGIYMFCRRFRDRLFVLYIGSSDDYRKECFVELRFHRAFKCIKDGGVTHLATMPFKGDREETLKDFIAALNPPCNFEPPKLRLVE